MVVKSLGPCPIEVAIGYKCTESRKTHLAAMRVTSHDQVSVVSGHFVKHSQVRCVRDAQPKVGRTVERASNGGVVVASDMGIVDAASVDHAIADLDGRASIIEVAPTS